MMDLILDVVDLLQLQEIWSWRPSVTAFSRLQRRDGPPGLLRFDLEELVPRLTRLRHSPEWRQNHSESDPAKVPLRDFLATDLLTLYPDTDAATICQQVFRSAYQAFVVGQYRGTVAATCSWLRALAAVRCLAPDDYLDADHLPRSGSPDWIPADITDEIRSLDARYRLAEAGTPAAYVVAEQFWSLLVKAGEHDLAAIPHPNQFGVPFTRLLEVAHTWNRSPSVVGLCYQVALEEL
ncbi:MAG TPA: hypothetical protein VHO69_08520 [Phototrophicaceae bacterium]|nr:hypothetical protein [Phototrophicaceae bacterium]